MKPCRILLSWSSGKDSAWALHVLQQQSDVQIVGLLTTFNEVADRVSMHGVRRSLVKAQSEAVGIPLWSVGLPYPCSNKQYEKRMDEVIDRAAKKDITHVVFGDLFLEDVREYRINRLSHTSIKPLFPLWCKPKDTQSLAQRMLKEGLRAVLTCVDSKQLAQKYLGSEYNSKLLSKLPTGIDPCGERGEFHTFCYKGPMFNSEIPVHVGEVVDREDFHFVDISSAPAFE